MFADIIQGTSGAAIYTLLSAQTYIIRTSTSMRYWTFYKAWAVTLVLVIVLETEIQTKYVFNM